MPTRHILSCPACAEELLIDVEGAVGGVVQDTLRLVDHRRPENDSAQSTPSQSTPKSRSGGKGTA